MGAPKPQIERTERKSPPIISALLLGAVVLFLFITLLSRIFTGEIEAPKLKPKEDAKLQKRLKEIDEAEQYALLAKADGWYQCLHSGKPTYYLRTGEVWKYGVTTKGELGRYQTRFLLRNNVIYLVEFRGNIAECLKQEQIKLFFYPFLPENLARPPEMRLPRPPYNPIMR